jgi:hypothetical protein
MPRPKLRSKYSYYNFQLPPEDKLDLQRTAQARGRTLSTELLGYVQVIRLLKRTALSGEQVQIWMDNGEVNVAHNGTIVKI